MIDVHIKDISNKAYKCKNIINQQYLNKKNTIDKNNK